MEGDADGEREHGRDRFRRGSAQSGHHVRGGLPAAAHTSIVIAGGPESALYKTVDAGAHWVKLTGGHPGGG